MKRTEGLDRADFKFYDKGVKLIELVQKAVNAWDSSDRSQKRVLLETVHSNCLWDGERVIPEYHQPFDLIAVANAGQKEKTASEEAVDCDFEKWLPGEDLPRTVRAHRLYGKAKVFVRREKWRVRFVDEPEVKRTVLHGSRRRRAWLKNPIVFATQLRKELDAIPDGNQTMLAERHGVTRTRICQYLRLLDLPVEIIDYVGDPLNQDITANITEAALRELLSLPSSYEQVEAFRSIVSYIRGEVETSCV